MFPLGEGEPGLTLHTVGSLVVRHPGRRDPTQVSVDDGLRGRLVRHGQIQLVFDHTCRLHHPTLIVTFTVLLAD